ncbi:MAG: glycosyltransferase family 2 protein [Lachnospiraceae bacterium]|jgi:glycosyltransferase involved in cell wall biosynthesis|nr:glycosyltransferase family 2 protein [Lachnospiraceae bacterium]
MNNTLYIVVPCYNEEEVLQETANRLEKKLGSLIEQGKVSTASKIIFVNDGSGDATWQLIKEQNNRSPYFGGVNLSRNCGHQSALLAGLMTVMDDADMVISMDADLQDDIDAVDQMVDKFLAGTDIVYGVRKKRDTDSFFKKTSARFFYRLMNGIGVNTVSNHADYRLMSKRALQGLAEFGEVNLFLRGIVPKIGFSHDIVYYDRGERFAGESKYPLRKMISFAVEGITSLSVRPLRLITGLGILIILVSIAMSIYSLVRFFMGATIPGWTTLMISVWVIGGLILFALGIVGEYIGKIYMETKQRPRYIVEEYLR